MMSLEAASRPDLKRDRNSFEQLADLQQPCSVPATVLEHIGAGEEESRLLIKPEPETTVKKEDTPDALHNFAILDGAHTTSTDKSLSPHTASTSPSSFAIKTEGTTTSPPTKKAKLTFQEKEMRRVNKEIKDREKAEERAAHAEEKARKQAEREAERIKRDAMKDEKEAEKQRKMAEKEEKRQKLENDKKRKEEEVRKKNKGQLKLGNFLIPVSAIKSRAGSEESKDSALQGSGAERADNIDDPSAKSRKTEYETLFPPFCVYPGVVTAPHNRFHRDAPATQFVERTLDTFISSTDCPAEPDKFDVTLLFKDSGHDIVHRGKRCIPVREIMEDFNAGGASRPIDLTTDSQNSRIKRTRSALESVPLKFLKFREDVRPPYCGTYTSRPINGTARLARNPFRRDLPQTNYDYDSEAEWIEDEEGEDLKSGDEDEDLDEDEDMDGFLDDEHDESVNPRRLVLQGDLEPISTGLCWEDKKRRNTNVKMMRYRMEVILDPSIKSIDPFSTSYWESTTTSTSMEPPRIPLNSLKATSLNFNGALPSSSPNTQPAKSFFTTASSPSVISTSLQEPTSSTPHVMPTTDKDGKPKRLLPPEDMQAFKAAVVGSDLSKVGLIEVLKKKFHGRPGLMIKNTLETYAQRGRKGEKEVEKRWMLVDEGGQ